MLTKKTKKSNTKATTNTTVKKSKALYKLLICVTPLLFSIGCDVKISKEELKQWKQNQKAKECWNKYSTNGKKYSKCLEHIGLNGNTLIETWNPYVNFREENK